MNGATPINGPNRRYKWSESKQTSWTRDYPTMAEQIEAEAKRARRKGRR